MAAGKEKFKMPKTESDGAEVMFDGQCDHQTHDIQSPLLR